MRNDAVRSLGHSVLLIAHDKEKSSVRMWRLFLHCVSAGKMTSTAKVLQPTYTIRVNHFRVMLRRVPYIPLFLIYWENKDIWCRLSYYCCASLSFKPRKKKYSFITARNKRLQHSQRRLQLGTYRIIHSCKQPNFKIPNITVSLS